METEAKLFSRISSNVRRTRGNIREKEKGEEEEAKAAIFQKLFAGKEPSAEGAKHCALSKRQVSMLEQLLYSYAWTSPRPKLPDRFWISVRFRAGVSNFIRPLNSRPTWLWLVCKIPRANCTETISAATMCMEIRTASMPPNRRLASPGISLIFRLLTSRASLPRLLWLVYRRRHEYRPSLIPLIFEVNAILSEF